MALTLHQREITDNILESLKTNRFTLLSGRAGTGKTFSTKFIIQDIIARHKSVAITSTTNQAASVLSEEISTEQTMLVQTINKFLRMKPVYESSVFTLRTDDYSRIDIVDVLIVEEFSMLTEEVIKTLNRYIDEFNTKLKVLLVGDATQLILEPDSIKMLDIDDHSYFLEEPMRADKDSAIAEYGFGASAAIRAKEKPPAIDFENIQDIVKYSDHEEFIEAWKKSTKDLNAEDMKILCFTNEKVKSYNKNIKELYHNQTTEYAPGNVIVLRNPVALQGSKAYMAPNIMLPNNSRVKIKQVEELTINMEGQDPEKGWTIYPEGYDGKYFYIPKSKASLERFLKPLLDKKSWQSYYKNKDMFAFAHHAEAGTCHSAQGSSFEEVFIDASDIMTAQNFRNRLAYVAITRARKKVHIYLGTGERNFNAFKNKP